MSNTDEKLNLIIANQAWIEHALRSLSQKALAINNPVGIVSGDSASNLMLKAADDMRRDKLKELTQPKP